MYNIRYNTQVPIQKHISQLKKKKLNLFYKYNIVYYTLALNFFIILIELFMYSLLILKLNKN